MAHVEGCERRCTNILGFGDTRMDRSRFPSTHAVWQRERQVPPASPDCHALRHTAGLAPTFTIMSYTPTPSLFSTLLRRKTCVNLGTFLGAASVHRPPLHRLGEGSAGCRLLGSTDNASARPCDVPRWNLQPTMGPKSPLSSQVAESPSLTCVKG